MGWSSAVRKNLKIEAAPDRAVFQFTPEVIDWSRLVTLDFETFWGVGYTLSTMSTSEYVRDPRFKAQMVGIKIGKGKTKIYGPKQIGAALKAINWQTHSLLCHNTAFDGFILNHHYGITPKRYYDTLSMARGLHSNEIGASLDDVAGYYGKGSKIEDVLESTKDVLDWPKPMYDAAAKYCAQDVDLTYEIFKEMHAVYPPNEMELIHMTVRMFCSPVLRVDIPRVQAEYEREVLRREDLLLTIVDPRKYDNKDTLKKKVERELVGKERDILIAKRVIGSNEKFAQLLLDTGLPERNLPMKVSPAYIKKSAAEKAEVAQEDKYTYAFAKDDLEFTDMPEKVWELYDDLDPEDAGCVLKASTRSLRLQALVDTRIAVKSTTNITRAERFLTAGKDGMRLPVGYSYYRAHCLTGDAQVLTRDGWVALAVWRGGEIAQWSQTATIEFAHATANQFEVDESLVQADSRYHTCTYTKGHTLPTLTSYGTFKSRKAGEALDTRFDIPISGLLDGGADISVLQAQIAVMVQADGNVRDDVSRGRCVRFGFTKQRKIDRCRALLAEAGIEYTKANYGRVVHIRVGAAGFERVTFLLGANKEFSPLLYDAPAETKQAFINELTHWDGDVEPQPNGFTYSTTSAYNANFVATMAHLTDRSAFISERERQGNWATSYRVYVRKNTQTRSSPEHYTEVPFKGTVYCPTTMTGFFLVRQRGNIVVTGNTGRWGGNNKMNMQNLTRGGELRLSILAAPGHQMAVADSSQIEARVNAWLWDQDDLLESFSLGKDIYSEFASDIYKRLITKSDKNERHVGKASVLGLGYQMGPDKFQMTLAKGALGGPKIAFTREQCVQIVQTYRRRFFGIANGWTTCSRIIEEMAAGITGEHKCLTWGNDDGIGYINLPNGMRLKYPDLKKARGDKGWDEWSYQSGDIRKKIYGGSCCENLVQALARIIVAEQMVMIDKKYPVVMATHDEPVTHPKTKEAQKCYDYMHKCMTTPMWWCPTIPLAAEGGFADNYSK